MEDYEPASYSGDLRYRVYDEAQSASGPKAEFKRLAQFLAEYVPLSYAIEPIVRSGSLYSLTAKTGAGKTAWMISISLSIATGRSDIMGFEVPLGRVAYCTFENPDDVRMRMLISAYLFGISVEDISERLLVLDMRTKPEAVATELERESRSTPFALIFVDTFAAFFDGDDVNNPVQAGEFVRRMRPFTRMSGLPATVIATHPVKNAADDNLVPYGAGAILNEVDGNLTLTAKAESGTIRLHWQGKLRGLEFQPREFRFEVSGAPHVLDAKGREVHLPTMRPATSVDAEAREKADVDCSKALMQAIKIHPKATQREFATALDRSPSTINKKLAQLKRDKLIDLELGVWSLTARGEKALDRAA